MKGEKLKLLIMKVQSITGILKNVTEGGFEIEAEIKIKGKTKRD